MLLDLIQGAEVEPLRLPPTLVVRESTVSSEASRSTGSGGAGRSM
jgi:hypothetical protein